ncbi:MAG: transglutaminase domain-containing protein [Clostridia bacterium]|jgi:transglutaminase-like putative cysteine protease|nr:transglutaminase domain-containing protein [Clostridia bacterium]
MKRNYQILLLVLLISISFATSTYAASQISFVSDVTEITAPAESGLFYPGKVKIEGTSKLEKIWLCVRGPAGEVTYYPINVTNNTFQYQLSLRFGPGTYTIWVGNDSQNFDGSIRFEVINSLNEDLRYSEPSAYIDSDNQIVTSLSNSLINPKMTDEEKLKAIYGWVTRNISYDYKAYQEQKNELKPASLIIQEKKGMCRDYSFVVAALARAAGLEARVVFGQASDSKNSPKIYHAWNEVKIDGSWVSLDATWDAGYIRAGKFISAPRQKYFNPDTKVFNQTHQAEKITLD